MNEKIHEYLTLLRLIIDAREEYQQLETLIAKTQNAEGTAYTLLTEDGVFGLKVVLQEKISSVTSCNKNYLTLLNEIILAWSTLTMLPYKEYMDFVSSVITSYINIFDCGNNQLLKDQIKHIVNNPWMLVILLIEILQSISPKSKKPIDAKALQDKFNARITK